MLPVAVIGSGIIGASIAWRLAQAGYSVTILEARKFGAEASWAGAGILAPGDDSSQRESLHLYPAFLDDLKSESGLPIDSHIDSGEGWVDPREILRALQRVLTVGGVEIRERTPVTELDTESAAAVVISAGAWSSEISLRYRGCPIALPECFPVKGHLIGYHMRPGMLGGVRRSGHTYILQRSNGFVIAGSTEERIGFDRRIDSRICQRIHRRAAALWPELRGKLFDECWIGFRPATVTGLPEIRRIAGTNIWLAYGHYRNGILLAPVTARRIAGEIISSLETDSSAP